MDLIKVAEQAFAAENPVEHPSFNTGDTVSVHYKIVEGNKERIQVFRGVVIQAVDRFGKNFGAGGFAGAAGAGKQVGMANAPGGDLILQGRYDGFLANNIHKLARTPLAVQRTVQCNHPL